MVQEIQKVRCNFIISKEMKKKTTYKISRSCDKRRIEFSRSLSHKKFQIVEQKEATVKRILLLRELN